MGHLGSLSGKGVLKVRGRETPVRYAIDVHADRVRKSAAGLMTGPADALAEAFNAGTSTLVTKNGAEISVIVEHLQGREARILVSGGVPGF